MTLRPLAAPSTDGAIAEGLAHGDQNEGLDLYDAVVCTTRKPARSNWERCVFDICGGAYRLIVAFKFSAKVAFIKFIGTHAQYDRVDAAAVSEFYEAAMTIHPIRTKANHAAATAPIQTL